MAENSTQMPQNTSDDGADGEQPRPEDDAPRKELIKRARDSPAADISTSRRETGILAAAVTAIPLLVASGISVIPQLHGVWPTAIGVAVLAVIVVVVGVQIVRSARNLLVGQAVDTEVVAYTDDRQTGILLKGDIQNVSLRVSTTHRIVDALAHAIPLASRQEALYNCGVEVGKSWVADFHRELPRLEIAHDDIAMQLLKWSEYDATAGMGRLTIAVDPSTGDGLVVLSNSFLSRMPSRFALNWWFAGYLAGSLNELLGRPISVSLIDPTSDATRTTMFHVSAESHDPEVMTPPLKFPDPRSLARGKVWLSRLKTPLPSEAPSHDR
jgi:hypothetical protein